MIPYRFSAWLTATAVAAAVLILAAARVGTAGIPSPPARVLEDAPPEFRDQFMPRHPAPFPVAKRPGHYTAKDWARAIDSVWGPGLSWGEHKSIWENFWLNTDANFSCFPGLDASVWQDVWDRYYPEILDTVSRGRLSAMVDWSCVALREAHTTAFDTIVVYTRAEPGVPLFVVGNWGVVNRFGAGLTSLPDSSLLVYKVANPHPLGLVPGDIVLGYDRRPWKEIYPELMAAELPLVGWWVGSNPKSSTESFLVGAGSNWHLFDTIDVVKYATGDTVHLPTSLLVGQSMNLWATEQLDIPGVALPDYLAGELTSWGIITGTHVGYIYSLGWFPRADSISIINTWLAALDTLRNVHHVSGVILDFRTNYGTAFSFSKVLDYLFDSSWQAVELARRCGGHFNLCLETTAFWRNLTNIPGAIDAHWDLPLAILTGPGAISGGDIYPMIISMHPMAKVFGKPSAGAFSGVSGYSLHAGWVYNLTMENMYLSDHPGEYLPRKEFPSTADFPWVDYQPVWLTPDGVAQGKDDVVEAAKAWIQTADVDQDGVLKENDNCPMVGNPSQDPIGPVGDVNLSGTITSADIIYMVNHVFKSGAPPLPCAAYGDANCSGTLTSADIVGLVNFVFKSGAVPCDVCTMATFAWSCT